MEATMALTNNAAGGNFRMGNSVRLAFGNLLEKVRRKTDDAAVASATARLSNCGMVRVLEIRSFGFGQGMLTEKMVASLLKSHRTLELVHANQFQDISQLGEFDCILLNKMAATRKTLSAAKKMLPPDGVLLVRGNRTMTFGMDQGKMALTGVLVSNQGKMTPLTGVLVSKDYYDEHEVYK